MTWEDESTQEEVGDPFHRLRGHALPSVLELDDVVVALEVIGFEGLRGAVDTPAHMLTTGEVSHGLQGAITDVALAVTLVPPGTVDRVHRRLTAPPLQLTQAELDERLPRPLVWMAEGDVVVEELEPGAEASIDARHDVGAIPLDITALPGYLLVVDRYNLEFPTANDIITILDRGGTADYAAVVDWATGQQEERGGFSDEERAAVMKAVRAGFRKMRAPPGLGDLQRLLALDRVMQVMAGPRDLEPLLRLERPMKILHASAVLAYDIHLREERILGVPLHGMDRLPARSEYLVAPDVAMAALQPVVLDKLLRLAYDPVDFHDAPPGTGGRRSRLQRQAIALLAPLTTTDVRGNLKQASGQQVEQEVLRFYLDVRHAKVVEPLIEWLLEHPDAYEDLGAYALERMPAALLPEVMRRYIEPKDPHHRPLLRRYLEAMPDRLKPQLAQILGGVGMDITGFVHGPDDVDVSGALDAFEAVEQKLARRRATQLVEELEANGIDPITFRESHRLIDRMAQVDAAMIEGNADLVINVLSVSALEMADSPLERQRALTRLETLPFGARQEDGRRAAEMTRARLEHQEGNGPAALQRLEELDAALEHPDVRALWVELMHDVYASHVNAGLYDAAAGLLDTAEALVPEDVDVPELRRG